MEWCWRCGEWVHPNDVTDDGQCPDCWERYPDPDHECIRCGYRKDDWRNEYCEHCHEEGHGY